MTLHSWGHHVLHDTLCVGHGGISNIYMLLFYNLRMHFLCLLRSLLSDCVSLHHFRYFKDFCPKIYWNKTEGSNGFIKNILCFLVVVQQQWCNSDPLCIIPCTCGASGASSRSAAPEQRACAVHPGARRRSVLKWGGWQKNSGDGHYTAGFPFTMSLNKHRDVAFSHPSP